LKIVALSALSGTSDTWAATCAAHPEELAAWAAGDYQLQFFTPAENQLLDQAMEMIIPADHHSGGAHAAKVSLLADRLVSTGSDSWRTEWRDGLQLLQEEAAKSSLAEALARAAAGEAHPQTDLERFFVTLKQMTVNGYYSSEIGIHQDLEYQGNTYLDEFPECAKRP
jgi:gluconate 2-dehydrogenase gamma chain